MSAEGGIPVWPIPAGKEPPRHSVLGALSALLVAENGGDIVDEVFILCDALGIPRPVEDADGNGYHFPWEEDETADE